MRAQTLGLWTCLKEAFPNSYEEILLTASYLACEGNVMMNIDDFLQRSLVGKDLSLSPQRTGELFASITKKEQMKFFSLWKDYALKDDETIAYDVTSLSTYADLPLAEHGYNRDKEYLPQLNIGLLYASDSHLPLGFFLYSGSVVDKVFLTTAMDFCTEFDIDRVLLTKPHLAYLRDRHIAFLMAVPKSQKLYKEVMEEVASNLRSFQNHIPKTNCYGVKKELVIDGESYALYIYFNTKSASDEENILFAHIDRLGEFNLRTISLHKQRAEDLEQTIIRFYQKIITTREIADLIEKIYGHHYFATTVFNIVGFSKKI